VASLSRSLLSHRRLPPWGRVAKTKAKEAAKDLGR